MSDFWWAMIAFLVYIPLISLWFFSLFDLFARRDLSGLAKALWALVIVFLPLIGMVIYFIARPKEADTWVGGDYSYSAATYPGSHYSGSQQAGAVRDIEALSQLHDRGTISDEEFSRMKDQVLAAPQ
jgi:hypothetical protein